ncbi:DUF3127 domain-containing protein [Saccharicrinis aurantiacus]|uniref:DUF3127 domain-containing protein n=1 Tax=Saccharicrinis aurantiacus TaxID=1849719 RepID=UPI00094FA092|nr:DUF3127 domain-containing protein [Saccharicrinis aurantiacus]
MDFNLIGNIVVVENEQQISASFKKREFVIEVVNERNSDWNDFIKFQLTQDRCSQVDGFSVGEPVKVSFNIRGRKWEKDGKVNYFSNLEAWRLEKVQPNTAPDMPPPAFTESEVPPAGPNEDLPF